MRKGTGTGFIENIRLVYRSYGGFRSLLFSGYMWTAVFFSVLSWRKAIEGTWTSTALSVLPTLAGFSIAAYAIFFSVLNEREREALSKPEPNLNGRAPLLVLASSVSHAVVVQILAILIAIVFESKPAPDIECIKKYLKIAEMPVSFAGLFITIYGILMVLASVLSIFRILTIKANVK